jgi:hypothetical protein
MASRFPTGESQTILTSESHFHIEFDAPMNILEVNRTIRAIGNLLSLLVGEAVHPRKIHLITKASVGNQEVSVNYLVPPRSALPSEMSEFEMTLPLRDFDETKSASQLFQEWFRNESTLRPVCDLLLSTVYNPGQDVQTTFLSLAQALESFHRRTCNGTYLPKTDYTKIREALAEAIPVWSKFSSCPLPRMNLTSL